MQPDARPDGGPLLLRGQVRHRRLRPALHAFAYANTMLLLPMRRLRERPCPLLSRNRRAWLSFHDRDHGDGRDDALAWADQLLRQAGVHDADGEVWLQTYPRVLGRAFKPVSFWYCERRDGTLAAVLAEVNNTFGERHCYLLDGPDLRWGHEQQARKVFHVSPFCRVQGAYRFRFMRTADRLVARVDHDDAQGALLQTCVSGQLQPLTAARWRQVALALPGSALGVIVRIHWQALQLWLKRVPFFTKPEAPEAFTTR